MVEPNTSWPPVTARPKLNQDPRNWNDNLLALENPGSTFEDTTVAIEPTDQGELPVLAPGAPVRNGIYRPLALLSGDEVEHASNTFFYLLKTNHEFRSAVKDMITEIERAQVDPNPPTISNTPDDLFSERIL